MSCSIYFRSDVNSKRKEFTEIDHNYVNPLTDQFLHDLEESIDDFKFWENKTREYQSKYVTFNEYMTHALFSLYSLDQYGSLYLDTIQLIQENFMERQRGGVHFSSFNRELLK